MATVVGLFDNVTQAQNAVQQLRNAGISPNDIGVAMRSNNTAATTTTTDVTTDTGVGGAATGAMTGGALGGLAGLLIGIGAITVPGIGPVLQQARSAQPSPPHLSAQVLVQPQAASSAPWLTQAYRKKKLACTRQA